MCLQSCKPVALYFFFKQMRISEQTKIQNSWSKTSCSFSYSQEATRCLSSSSLHSPAASHVDEAGSSAPSIASDACSVMSGRTRTSGPRGTDRASSWAFSARLQIQPADAASSTSESARVELAKRMITDRMSRSAAGSRVKHIIAQFRADEILRPATSNHLHVTGYMQFHSSVRLPTVKACGRRQTTPSH